MSTLPQTRLESLSDFADRKFGLRPPPSLTDTFIHTHTKLIKQSDAVNHLLNRTVSRKKQNKVREEHSSINLSEINDYEFETPIKLPKPTTLNSSTHSHKPKTALGKSPFTTKISLKNSNFLSAWTDKEFSAPIS